jgi:Mrp family chromosome partitioning ATPase
MAPLVMSGGQIRSICGVTVIGAIPAGRRPAPPPPNREAEISPPSTIAPREDSVDPLSNRVIQLLLAKLLNGEAGDRRRYAARSVVVTSSAADGPERSRVAELIAAVAARNGERVLLIDADVADEKETELPGFLDLLRNDCAINTVMHSSGTNDYLRIDKGRRDSEQRDSPRRESDETQFAGAFRYFDLTVIDAGALTDNYRVGPLVAGAEEVLLVAELFGTLQSAVVAEAEVAALMGTALTSVVLVDKTLRA